MGQEETVVQKAEREFAVAFLRMTAEDLQKLEDSGSALADDLMFGAYFVADKAREKKEKKEKRYY